MRNFTSQYTQIMVPEMRVAKNLILPRNIYRISTYKDGVPPTKVGLDSRYVFVIGKVDGKIHCLLLNNILPADFMMFINKLRDKTKNVEEGKPLSSVLKKLPRDGKLLFEGYVKNNRRVYSHILDNYRTYVIEKIQNVWEIRFESGFLSDIFNEDTTKSTITKDIKKEVNENDG